MHVAGRLRQNRSQPAWLPLLSYTPVNSLLISVMLASWCSHFAPHPLPYCLPLNYLLPLLYYLLSHPPPLSHHSYPLLLPPGPVSSLSSILSSFPPPHYPPLPPCIFLVLSPPHSLHSPPPSPQVLGETSTVSGPLPHEAYIVHVVSTMLSCKAPFSSRQTILLGMGSPLRQRIPCIRETLLPASASPLIPPPPNPLPPKELGQGGH